MILKVKATLKLKGKICLPASKSYSIRAFIIAACGGSSKILSPSNCNDALVAKYIAKCLGSDVLSGGKNAWRINACKRKASLGKINVKESGTALRFILPLLPLFSQQSSVVGEGTLVGRPNYLLTEVLREQGIKIKGKGKKEGIPIDFKGGILKGGKIFIDGGLSSQFISALLIACPQISNDTEIFVKGAKLVSSDYIKMTTQILRKSGINIQRINERLYKIKGQQKFAGLKDFTVPSDYGLAAFFLAAGALLKSSLVLNGHFDDKLIQADGRIIKLLRTMGVKFRKNSEGITIKGPFGLRGGAFSLKDCPDLVPIMSILALFAKGKTRLYNIKHARVKESDRISDLRKELLKIGAKVTEKSNELIIYPQKEYKRDVLLNPHNDHRLAMSFAVLGLRLGASIKDIECVKKSYPDFVADFKKIGAVTTIKRH